MYYNQNNSGGAYFKVPTAPAGRLAVQARSGCRASPSPRQPPRLRPAFGPGYMNDPRNQPWRMGRFDNGNPHNYRMPFMPRWSTALTPFMQAAKGRRTARSAATRAHPPSAR